MAKKHNIRKKFSAHFTKTHIFENKQCITVDNSYKLLYSVYVDRSYAVYFCKGKEHTREVPNMNIIINNSSMQPIYEQIVEQIKAAIMKGVLATEESLPSVRTLSKDLRISALTVKKAYDTLEQDGFIITVHGKGSFVAGVNVGLRQEEQKKEIEQELETVIRKGKTYGMSSEELTELFQLILEE